MKEIILILSILSLVLFTCSHLYTRSRQMADESTSQFMATMYGMVQDKGIGYAETITEAKRRFISGDFGEKYREPYYRAPFVYYGN